MKQLGGGLVRLSQRSINTRRAATLPQRHLKATCNSHTVHTSFQLAQHPFDEISQQNLISLNALLATHVRNGHALSAWLLFRQMHYTVINLDGFTFTPVLCACGLIPNIERGQQVHALLVKIGFGSETVVNTALVDMYSKCGFLHNAICAFEETISKDIVLWNTMLSGFIRHGFVRDAIDLFQEMRRNGVEFSGFTLSSVLKACCSMKALQQGKQIHTLVIVRGCDLLVLGTALVDFYSNCGFIRDAIEVFCRLNCKRDNAIYNALISGCVQNRLYEHAFQILKRMRPNEIALTSVLVACSVISNLSNGKQIHCVVIRRGFESDTILCNALLDMYAKCGNITTARLVFNQISEKNVASWTSIIDAYGCHGCGIESLDLFEQMRDEKNGVSPNSVTYLAVLSACGHSGLVEEGRNCFLSMREKQGINPGSEHYACFIDLLGRAGCMEEAWSLLHDMRETDFKPTGVVWAALLNACRFNCDVVRGELAAKCLFELEPENSANYVLLSNFYVAVGRYESSEILRRVMKEKGLKKEAGSSWIAVQFCNGDAASAIPRIAK